MKRAWFCVLALLGGCGGDDDGGVAPITVSLPSEAALDGWVESDGTAAAVAGGPLTGDFDAVQAGVGYRQFFSFDISGIPSGATIVLATLQLDQQVVTGTPFATHGVVIADHVDYGAALDAADYAGGTLTSNIGTLGGDATIGIKTLDVTSRVQADVTAARTRSQYRVRFSVLGSDSDGVNDYVTYTDAENSSTAAGAVPVLLVSYQ